MLHPTDYAKNYVDAGIILIMKHSPDPIPLQSFINASCNAIIMELLTHLDAHTNQVYQPSNISAPNVLFHHCH